MRKRAVAIGEAMVEMAPVEGGLYRRSYAGDTYNTAWHMARALADRAEVGYVTRVGTDAVSDGFLAEAAADGVDTGSIGRDPARTMGLYLITLDGAERSFSYWRSVSAARALADDPAWLAKAMEGADLIHVSGITLAILEPAARQRLIAALGVARSAGTRVSFDPNIRPALWSAPEEARAAVRDALAVTDIALPSFDDEAGLWGDATPEESARRMMGAGVAEVVVKNGAGPVTLAQGGSVRQIDTPPAAAVRDTTGAGDGFNAGYLASRLMGHDGEEAVRFAQALSAAVIGVPGARLPRDSVPQARPA